MVNYMLSIEVEMGIDSHRKVKLGIIKSYFLRRNLLLLISEDIIFKVKLGIATVIS